METSRSITQKIENEGTMCPSFQALDMVMDKWTPKVLFLLQDGPMHYMQLKRQVGGSTQKMVTQTLRKLEKEGLVTRTVYPTSPPTVEYALTPLGEMLQSAFQELLQWARIYTAQFQSMRENDSEANKEEDFHKN
ncbi:transcriptional regulator [Reticulibacter mediterranei]|uniref:Transcriptional regulator n=1 Tax=Reticulibacter mediterranei TaxID=2778369 RepID=A0A8J3N8F6_9CHLR|nr:helix-turn-helix domain-containing protein [Reticulibacter mediterranei]GHO99475.1 transcriptional regulator [Reticulibacter mediterranei]